MFMTIPLFASAEMREEAFGKNEGYPAIKNYGVTETKYMVGSFSNMAQFHPHNILQPADKPFIFDRPTNALDGFKFIFMGEKLSLDDYMNKYPVTSLLILRGNNILYEKYQYARNDKHLFLGQSMTKSVTSLAVGLLVADGKINNINDRIDKYVPELKNCVMGAVTIKNILGMNNGLAFAERYDGKDDITKYATIKAKEGRAKALCAFTKQEKDQGELFNYAGINSEALILLVRKLINGSASDYVSTRIWQKIGTEQPAKWLIDGENTEFGLSFFNATTRDWGRLGRLLANDGQWQGEQILPSDFLINATSIDKQPPSQWPGNAQYHGQRVGYGWQFWLVDSPKRQFFMRGLYGQFVYIDPQSQLVIVQTAVDEHHQTYYPLLQMFRALAD